MRDILYSWTERLMERQTRIAETLLKKDYGQKNHTRTHSSMEQNRGRKYAHIDTSN